MYSRCEKILTVMLLKKTIIGCFFCLLLSCTPSRERDIIELKIIDSSLLGLIDCDTPISNLLNENTFFFYLHVTNNSPYILEIPYYKDSNGYLPSDDRVIVVKNNKLDNEGYSTHGWAIDIDRRLYDTLEPFKSRVYKIASVHRNWQKDTCLYYFGLNMKSPLLDAWNESRSEHEKLLGFYHPYIIIRKNKMGGFEKYEPHF